MTHYPSYKEIVPVGTTLIIAAASFGLGAVYSNLVYDYQTLWSYQGDPLVFKQSFNHYLAWANTPRPVHYILHGVMLVGFIGALIKLYKPHPESTYFEYGSLGLFVLSIVIYLTNLRTGINSCFYDNWGEVSMETGINVIAASHFFIVVLLVGVIVLQGGLYYAEWYDGKLKEEFLAEQQKEESKSVPELSQENTKKAKRSDKKVTKKD